MDILSPSLPSPPSPLTLPFLSPSLSSLPFLSSPLPSSPPPPFHRTLVAVADDKVERPALPGLALLLVQIHEANDRHLLLLEERQCDLSERRGKGGEGERESEQGGEKGEGGEGERGMV